MRTERLATVGLSVLNSLHASESSFSAESARNERNKATDDEVAVLCSRQLGPGRPAALPDGFVVIAISFRTGSKRLHEK